MEEEAHAEGDILSAGPPPTAEMQLSRAGLLEEHVERK